MKKIAAALLILTLSLISPAFAARTTEEVQKLLDARQVTCWVEGTLFGDLILGSRGSITFVYLDEKMSNAIRDDHGLAPWADDLNQYYGSPGTEKKAIFLIQLETNKPWDVEISKFKVGSYSLTKNDILSPSWTNPIGPLESGIKAQMAVAVPAVEVKRGSEVAIGYGDDVIKWKVPR